MFMADCEKLLEQAQNAPAALRFSQLCRLAECFGFEIARQRGSHRIYKRSGYMRMMTFQDDGGKAKPYQVRQLLDVIDHLRERNQ